MKNMIDFPLYGLDLNPFLTYEEKEAVVYDLFGIVNHYGSMNGGHYVAIVKNEVTQEWIRYDDSAVTVIAES